MRSLELRDATIKCSVKKKRMDFVDGMNRGMNVLKLTEQTFH